MKRIFILAFCAVCGLVANAGEPYRGLPSGYRQLTWLKSTGSHWIDTEVAASANLAATMDYILHNAGGTVSLGQNVRDDTEWRFFAAGSYLYIDVGSSREKTQCYSANSRQRVEITMTDEGKSRMKVFNESGKQLADVSPSSTPGTIVDTSLGVFGGPRNADKTSIYGDKMTLYSLKIWESGLLVRDYVPAYEEATGKNGLYDIQNNTFYTNRYSPYANFTQGVVVPMGVTPSIAYDTEASAWKMTLQVTGVTGGSGKLYVYATDANQNTTEYLVSDSVTGAGTYYHTFSDLASGAAYTIGYKTVYTGDGATESDVQTYYFKDLFTGGVSLEKVADADEADGTVGSFKVSLAGGAVAAGDMAVNYTVNASSTAVADQTYVAISGTATIPAGKNSGTISVIPKIDKSITTDSTVALQLAEGAYVIVTAGEVPLTIKNASEFAWWFYDVDAGTINDGTWQFKAATGTSAQRIYVSDVNVDSTKGPVPTEKSNLDLNKKMVMSTSGATASVETMGYCFYRGSTQASCAQYLGTVTWPAQLRKVDVNTFRFMSSWEQAVQLPYYARDIGESAFQGCSKITIAAASVPGFTSIGPNAFNGVSGFTGDLDLSALVSTDLRSAFAGTGLTSIHFGSKVTGLNGGYSQGPVAGCKSLTNVTFAATAVKLTPGWVFDNCTALKELDLSSVYYIDDKDDRGGYFSGSGIGKITFSDKLTYLSARAFEGATHLTNIVFTGTVPMTNNVPYLKGVSASQKVKTTIYLASRAETNALGKCWLDYSANGKIRHSGTTWASDYVAEGIDLSMRPLVTLEPTDGLEIFVR